MPMESPAATPTDTSTPAPSPTPTQTFTATPSPTETATITPSPTPRPGLPVQLEIPTLDVDAFIEHVGLTEDLAMDVPSKVENVAWYKLGYRPGEDGNAVIAGHLDTVTGAPAVFWDLESLEPGDEILVRGLDGVKRRFIVDYHTRYPYDDAPVQQIFGPAEAPQLVLITCNGKWDRANRNYSHRVVVYATAVQDGT
ncbi:MAG: sortase domain-bontaining protein [Anaerolineae bacterium]